MSNAKINQRARDHAHVLIGVLREVDGFFQDPSASKESVMEGTAEIVRVLTEYIYSGNTNEQVKSIIAWHTDPDEPNLLEGMC